ncbi:MAG: hypothetical protein LJE93_10210 [Acidobacteria bacterium]|jgi:hypothetical protein|nr:hypothetical protein [Acidobacteriota bacterium]
MNVRNKVLPALIFTALLFVFNSVAAEEASQFSLELELGPAWQSKNTVQIPNTDAGTRFSLEDLVGSGPWAAGRLYFTWNINRRHSLRVLAAPLSYTESGIFDERVEFAGESYEAVLPVEATYQFNSWRVGYRYQFKDGERWDLWVGFTAKIRDAKIALSQGGTSSEDTDVGFVPLLSFAANYRFADRWYLVFDFEGLAGGPGRAIDTALKVGYDIDDRWGITAGYRTVEGGADIEDVYNFAWFQYAVVSGIFRF